MIPLHFSEWCLFAFCFFCFVLEWKDLLTPILEAQGYQIQKIRACKISTYFPWFSEDKEKTRAENFAVDEKRGFLFMSSFKRTFKKGTIVPVKGDFIVTPPSIFSASLPKSECLVMMMSLKKSSEKNKRP